jgi:hypothetical protein
MLDTHLTPARRGCPRHKPHPQSTLNSAPQAYEAAKAADDLPLEQRAPDLLRDLFAAAPGSAPPVAAQRSAVFLRLAGFGCHRALLREGGHKGPLVRLAEFERKCRKWVRGPHHGLSIRRVPRTACAQLGVRCGRRRLRGVASATTPPANPPLVHRWYPNSGTTRFFEQLSEEAVAVAAAEGADADGGWLACAEGAPACAACAAALGVAEGCGAEAGPSSAPVPAPAGPRVALSDAGAVLSALGEWADAKHKELLVAVTRMPEKCGAVPDIFAALQDPKNVDDGEESDFVEVLEQPPRAEAAAVACDG